MRRGTAVWTMILFAGLLGTAGADWVTFGWDYGDFEPDFAEVRLSDVLARPEAYMDQRIEFPARVHGHGNIEMAFYTPFNGSEYNNFSVWPYEADLWEENVHAAPFPLCFVRQSAGVAADLTGYRRYDPVRVRGIVDRVFQGRPWIRVLAIEAIREPAVSDTLLHLVRSGLDQVAAGDPRAAGQQFDFVLGEPIPNDLRAFALWKGGQAATRAGMFDLAVQYLDDAARTDRYRSDGLVRRDLGFARLHDGNAGGARDALEESIRHQSRDATTRLYLSIAYERLGEPEQARLEAAKAVAIRPTYTDAHLQRARLEWRQGNRPTAVTHYQETIELEETSFAAHYEIGRVYSELAQWDDALRHLERGKELDPDHADVHYRVGVAYFAKGENRTAERNLRDALARDDGHLPAWQVLADLVEGESRWNDLVPVLEGIARLRSADPAPALRIARTHMHREDWAAAAASFARTVDLGDASWGALNGWGQALFNQQKWGEARPILERAVAADAGRRSSHRNLAHVCYVLYDYPAAIVHYDASLDLDANDLDAWQKLLFSRLMLTDFEEAAADALAGLRHFPNDMHLQNNAAYALLHAEGDAARAVELARAAVAGEGENPIFLHTYGWAKRVTGDVDGAIEALTRAADLTSDAPEVYLQLGLALEDAGRIDVARDALARAVAFGARDAASVFGLEGQSGEHVGRLTAHLRDIVREAEIAHRRVDRAIERRDREAAREAERQAREAERQREREERERARQEERERRERERQQEEQGG